MIELKEISKEDIISLVDEAITNNQEVYIWDYKYRKIYINVK